jgi:hypothetical protein
MEITNNNSTSIKKFIFYVEKNTSDFTVLKINTSTSSYYLRKPYNLLVIDSNTVSISLYKLSVYESKPLSNASVKFDLTLNNGRNNIKFKDNSSKSSTISIIFIETFDMIMLHSIDTLTIDNTLVEIFESNNITYRMYRKLMKKNNNNIAVNDICKDKLVMNVSEMLNDSDCSICMTSYDNNRHLLKCGHINVQKNWHLIILLATRDVHNVQ